MNFLLIQLQPRRMGRELAGSAPFALAGSAPFALAGSAPFALAGTPLVSVSSLSLLLRWQLLQEGGKRISDGCCVRLGLLGVRIVGVEVCVVL